MQFDFLDSLDVSRGSAAPSRPLNARPAAAALTARARELLAPFDAEKLRARVAVKWNARMRTTAGLASYERSLVMLNPRLAEFGDAEIDKTLRHELAHLLAHARAGRRRIAPHGAEWKQACRDLGLPDEKRCHDLPLPRRKMKTNYVYRCPSCSIDVLRVRPFRRRVACLACCRAHNRGRYHDRFRLQKITGS
jgi:predicted SprT family Zn-dependent metalloprotease